MRFAFLAGTAILAAASSGKPAWAQAAGGIAPVPPDKPGASCDALPPGAVQSVPAPFDAFMRLVCRDPLGQGLQAAAGFRWAAPGGMPIGLSATSAAGGPDAAGMRHFPTSWYTELSPVEASPVEQRRLKENLKRAIRPGVLDKAVVLKLRARTSNGEDKLIVLILPGTGPKPAWLIGLECNGTCFREDRDPLVFAGSPG